MKYVYVAYSGMHVDRGVSGVFSTEEAALAYAKASVASSDPVNEIERLELDNPDGEWLDIPLP